MKRERDIVLFRIDRKVGLLLLGVLGVVVGGFAVAQQLTMTTSYPVPSGIYNQLVTTGNSGTAPADTMFNRNAGNTLLVPASNAGGMVGIGTSAPTAKLDVNGNASVNGAANVTGELTIGRYAAAPAGACTDGSLYYNTTLKAFQGCQNGAWGPLASIASGTLGGYCDNTSGAPKFPATSCASACSHSGGSCPGAYYVTTCAAGWTAFEGGAWNPGSTTYTSYSSCVKN